MMKFTVVYMGLAILAMAQPATAFDFFGFETTSTSTEGNHLRRLNEDEPVPQLSAQEITKLKAERKELKGKKESLQAVCGPEGTTVGDLKKAFKKTDKEHKRKKKECKGMDAGAEKKACAEQRKTLWKATKKNKQTWKDARTAAKPRQESLKATIKELRKVSNKLKRNRKRVKKLNGVTKKKKKKNRTKRKGQEVRKELVDGQCVADHVCGSIRGDPHMQTFDGERYDCQGEGEFVVAKAINSDSTFEIQARFENIGAEHGKERRVSITKAVSITTGFEGEPDLDVFVEPVGEDGDECQLFYFVDGVATTFETAVPGISYEAGDDYKGTSDYVFFTGSGLMYSVFAKVGKFGCVMNSKVCLPPSLVQEEDIVGLLGTPDGDMSNDWTNSRGGQLDMRDTGKSAGYSYCTTNWCVREAADSIFGYLEGTDHSTYYNCDALYDNSTEAVLLEPPAECVTCCAGGDEDLYADCIVECSMADEAGRTEQCMNDIADAEVLKDVQSKCSDPKIAGDCNSMLLNKNCDWNEGSNRLFKAPGLNLVSCQEKCAATDGCTFYAFGHEGSTKENMCTGCNTEEEGLLDASNYDAYPMECKPQETEPKKAPPLEGQCTDMYLNTKCPHKLGENGHPDRLFREKDQTLASCQALCKADEDCGYYSFGTSDVKNANHQDVCMGCSAASAKETHTGFNFYSVHCLGEKAEDPKENQERCEHMHLDKKCDGGGNRLFRTVDQTVDECHDLCETTEGCNFYSFAEDGTFAGTCMGCKEEGDAHPHETFVFYPMDCQPVETEPEKVPADHGECPDMYLNTKCAHKLDDMKHPDRLFRSEGETLESCQELCEADQSCGFYSFGNQDAGGFAGVCMGCSGSESMETHTGFNFYSVDCVGDQEDPVTNEEVCSRMMLDTKCAQNDNRLFREEDLDVETCQKKCEDTDGCNFFSFMDEESDDAHGGTCMGCKSLADADVHERFVFYNKACKPIDPTNGPKKAPPVVGQCPDMYVNTKCPYKHSDRLFREEGIESVEECQTQCEEDENCLYYSFGTEAVKNEEHVGVCMGCTAESAKEFHTGFNFYSVGCVGEKVDPCSMTQTNKVCDWTDDGANRIFKDENTNMADCQAKCEATDSCNFYAMGHEGSRKAGTCTGCEGGLLDSDNFDAYAMECKPVDTRNADPCSLSHDNKVCDWTDDGANRIFKMEDTNIDDCEAKCEATDGCNFYAMARDGTEKEGRCTGCSGGLLESDNFDAHHIECKRVVVTRSDVCEADTKTCPDGTVLSRVGADCEFKDCPTPDNESDDDDDKAGTKGDPHFKTFGGEFYDFHGECDLALLKNPLFKDGLGMEIHIRTKITDWWSSVQAAAIKIGDDVLEIQGGNLDKWLWINGVENEDMEEGKWYHSSIAGFLVRYKKQGVGMEAMIYLKGAKEFLVLKTFKDFVRVDINWKESDNYHGATGLLGSYELKGDRVGRDGATHIANHNAFGQEWQVGAEEPKLFHSYDGAVISPNKCILPSDTEIAEKTQRRLAESNLTMEAIEIACEHLHKEAERKGCEYDVLSTQDISMSSSVW